MIRCKFFIFLALFTHVFSAPPLIPRKILFGNPEKYSPALSPDGSKLAFVAPDQKDVLNVWVRDLIGGGPDWQVTFNQGRGIGSFAWQFDGTHLLYMQDDDGDENYHLYQTDIQTKGVRDLTPFSGAAVGVVGYEPLVPNEILVQINKRDPTVFDVYRINLISGYCALEIENHDNVVHWIADHQLQVRAARSYAPNGDSVIRVRDEKYTPWREFDRWSREDIGQLLCFSWDGQYLYLVSSQNSDTGKLFKIDLKTGSRQLLIEDPKFDLCGAYNGFTFDIEAVGVFRERLDWVVLDGQVQADYTFLRRENEDLRIVSRDLTLQKWIVSYATDRHPEHFYLYDKPRKNLQFLFSANAQLDNYPQSPMTPITFYARDGMQLHGYLTLPLETPSQNLPTILFVHGGPWARDYWYYNVFTQWLANRGYAVLQVNYRGSSGYGKAYLNAGNREWAGKMHTDLLDGKQWMINQGYADANRVAIMGGSYGGYAALVGLAFTPNEFCCGIDIVGPSNLVTLLETVPPYWKPMKTFFDFHVGNLQTEREFLESRSPLFKVNQITRPLLVAQGANDPRVKQAESDQIVEAMRKNGKTVEYFLFPDEGHGFYRPENLIKFSEVTERFLMQYLGGRMEPELAICDLLQECTVAQQ